MSKKVGLFFGSFNPIHVGHMIIANHMVEFSDMNEVWFVVSPHSPFKQKSSLLADHHRLALVMEAVEDNPKFKVSKIEFELPQPSYTINTLVHLEERYPEIDFSLIMGEDNLRSFHKWKNYEEILNRCEICVYPRGITEQEKKLNINHLDWNTNGKVKLFDVPVMSVSASFIRDAIKAGRDIRYLLTEPVYKYISEMNFYK